MAKYSLIKNKYLQSRLEKRYGYEIASLKMLGFQHLAYCLEDHGPYTALSQFPIIPLALSQREILRIKWPFRLASANVLYSTPNPPSIALCMGMGIKFYSGFSDGTMMISSDFLSSSIPRAGSKITRFQPQLTLDDTWAVHQAAVYNKLREVNPLAAVMEFEHYVIMSALEEDITQYIPG